MHVGIGYHSGWGHRHHGWGHGHRGHFGHRGVSWGLSYGPSWGYHRGYGYGYPYAGYGDYVYRTPVVVQQPAVVQVPVQAPVQQAQPAPQQVTIINNYYNTSTPMSGANGLFGR